jgi:phosphoribosylamine--glycine ligase
VALGVVLAAAGYPMRPRKGDAITGLPADAADAVVFHAGTSNQGDAVVTSGGRVLCATALGATVREAQARAYALADAVQFDGVQLRRDIGYRAL